MISGTVSSALQAGFDYTTEDGFEIGEDWKIISAGVFGLILSSLPDFHIGKGFFKKVIKGRTESNTKIVDGMIEEGAIIGKFPTKEEKIAAVSHNNGLNEKAKNERDFCETELGELTFGFALTTLESIVDNFIAQ